MRRKLRQIPKDDRVKWRNKDPKKTKVGQSKESYPKSKSQHTNPEDRSETIKTKPPMYNR